MIAAVHGVAFGFLLDALCAVDVCWAASDARIDIEELDVGLLAADKGTLARVPKPVGNASLLHEFTQSAHAFGADEAWRLPSVLRRASFLRGLRAYGSNKHLAGFLKPILNKILFPDVISVCPSGHD